MFATFTAGPTNADVRVALIDRPEMLECVLELDAPGFRPDLIVLGEAELTALAGHPVREPWEAVAAIERLRAFGPEAVLASLGAGGAVLVDGTGCFHAQAEFDPDEQQGDGTTLDALLVKQDVARDQAYVDVGFWGGAVPGNLPDLEKLYAAGRQITAAIRVTTGAVMKL